MVDLLHKKLPVPLYLANVADASAAIGEVFKIETSKLKNDAGIIGVAF